MADRKKFMGSDGEMDVEKLFTSFEALESKLGSMHKPEVKRLEMKDLGSYFQEAAKNDGKLSDSSYQNLQDTYGLSKEVIDSFAGGESAKAELFHTRLRAEAGGDEGFDALIGWAKDTLTKEEKRVLANQLDSGDFDSARMAVQSLSARRQLAGQAPAGSQLSGGPPKGGGIRGFSNSKELTDAMGDKRYMVDTEYTEQIRDRIGATGNEVLDARAI